MAIVDSRPSSGELTAPSGFGFLNHDMRRLFWYFTTWPRMNPPHDITVVVCLGQSCECEYAAPFPRSAVWQSTVPADAPPNRHNWTGPVNGAHMTNSTKYAMNLRAGGAGRPAACGTAAPDFLSHSHSRTLT
ncbi:hypothetical protein SCAR479_09782 [Seiridium cardinale]|uniref:Uncharacterized protein n=1 Tax=Seiridium cardinale TaxID=138064 RepID=A0ABR2XIH5_9PEZI